MGVGGGSAAGRRAVALAFLFENLFGPRAFFGTEDSVSIGVKALDQGDFPLALKNLGVGVDVRIPGLTGLLLFAPEGLRGRRALLRAENSVTVGVKPGEQKRFPRLHGRFVGMKGEEQEK